MKNFILKIVNLFIGTMLEAHDIFSLSLANINVHKHSLIGVSKNLKLSRISDCKSIERAYYSTLKSILHDFVPENELTTASNSEILNCINSAVAKSSEFWQSNRFVSTKLKPPSDKIDESFNKLNDILKPILKSFKKSKNHELFYKPIESARNILKISEILSHLPLSNDNNAKFINKITSITLITALVEFRNSQIALMHSLHKILAYFEKFLELNAQNESKDLKNSGTDQNEIDPNEHGYEKGTGEQDVSNQINDKDAVIFLVVQNFFES